MIPVYNGYLFYYPRDIHAVYDITGERYLTMRDTNVERNLVMKFILENARGN